MGLTLHTIRSKDTLRPPLTTGAFSCLNKFIYALITFSCQHDFRNGIEAKTLIVDERHMRCPRCKEAQDILAFVPLQRVSEFVTETVPIVKCPKCKWLFAPAEKPF